MKVSIVTISYNQAEFLERALQSVINQRYTNIEYIVIDPGSQDSSRDIIERYRPMISKVILEADKGPADGLNKGFKHATGDIYGFLNSDDVLYSGAIEKAVACFTSDRTIDVVSGDSILIDGNDIPIRRLCSDHFSLISYAYGATFISQQSTFFKRSIFNKVQGFNVHNRCAWDGELFADIALAGGKFAVVREIWSGFRSHPKSLTSSGKIDQQLNEYSKMNFRKIMKRNWRLTDYVLKIYLRVVKHILNPRGIFERIRNGPVYGRLRNDQHSPPP